MLKPGPVRAKRARPRVGEPEPRQASRRDLRYAAAIENLADGSTSPCQILDISASGAQLALAGDGALAERFILRLGRNRRPNRLCRLVWRQGRTLGVAFIDQDPDA
ncbi:PilZ domain-containing protein [Phreatobacter stygius]|uniref:PilZ domain-containing protein n=1 Tax=Phreatobacter stygius TaxID=1940610 RepID=A0A4D7BAJ7_9HYPH|nr:PilZ domain-containing protein [Phreatobacter stygius]QCI65142.1 PilZ domain-containing protein [Phreatobacter stygius]